MDLTAIGPSLKDSGSCGTLHLVRGNGRNWVNEADVRRLYRLLDFDDVFRAEVRCIYTSKSVPSRKKVVSREIIGSERDFVEWAKTYSGFKSDEYGYANCYVGQNPRDAQKRVSAVQAVTLDVDPVEGKPTNSDAVIRTLTVCNNFTVCNSGNGLLFLRCFRRVSSSDQERIERFVESFQCVCRELLKPYSKEVRVDSTHDNARLIKLIGTLSCKGDIKRTSFLHIPDNAWERGDILEFLAPFKPGGEKALLAEPAYPPGSGTVGGDSAVRNPPRTSTPYRIEGLIPNGERNVYLTKLAGTLRRKGLGEAEILASLRAVNTERCKPPLDDEELKTIAGSVAKYAPQDSLGLTLPGPSLYGDSLVVKSVADLLPSYIEKLNERSKGGGQKEPELPTGFKTLDEATFGLRRGEVYVIAGRPSHGKSSYLLNVALLLARMGKRILVLSTEMSNEAIYDRLFAIGAQVDEKHINRGVLSEDDQNRLGGFRGQFGSYSISVSDSFQPRVATVASAVQRFKPDVLIFDYIQHIGGKDKKEAIDEFMAGLKYIARENNCAVLLASQIGRLMRALDYKTKEVITAKPTLQDLQWCSRIEAEAAFVLALHPTGESLDEQTQIIDALLLKNRFGPQVTAMLAFHKPTVTFREV